MYQLVVLQFCGKILFTYEKNSERITSCLILIIIHFCDNIMRIILFSYNNIFKLFWLKTKLKPMRIFLTNRLYFCLIVRRERFSQFSTISFHNWNFHAHKVRTLYQHLNFTNATRSQSKRNSLKRSYMSIVFQGTWEHFFVLGRNSHDNYNNSHRHIILRRRIITAQLALDKANFYLQLDIIAMAKSTRRKHSCLFLGLVTW